MGPTAPDMSGVLRNIIITVVVPNFPAAFLIEIVSNVHPEHRALFEGGGGVGVGGGGWGRGKRAGVAVVVVVVLTVCISDVSVDITAQCT